MCRRKEQKELSVGTKNQEKDTNKEERQFTYNLTLSRFSLIVANKTH